VDVQYAGKHEAAEPGADDGDCHIVSCFEIYGTLFHNMLQQFACHVNMRHD
jgi:hypothetical protein